MRKATLNRPFYETPAGTKLNIISERVFRDSRLFTVERVDGELLPWLCGPSKRTEIHEKFLDFD